MNMDINNIESICKKNIKRILSLYTIINENKNIIVFIGMNKIHFTIIFIKVNNELFTLITMRQFIYNEILSIKMYINCYNNDIPIKLEDYRNKINNKVMFEYGTYNRMLIYNNDKYSNIITINKEDINYTQNDIGPSLYNGINNFIKDINLLYNENNSCNKLFLPDIVL